MCPLGFTLAAIGCRPSLVSGSPSWSTAPTAPFSGVQRYAGANIGSRDMRRFWRAILETVTRWTP